jgi:hypothetical protein
VQLAEPTAGLDAELLHQHGARRPIGLERFGLAARAIQRQHQLAVQALAQRVRGGQALELGDDLVVPAECQVGLDSALERRQARLLEAGDLGLGERLVGQVGERGAAPQRQGIPQQRGGRRRIRYARVRHESLEAMQIELVLAEPQHVARRPREERPRRLAARPFRLEQLAKPRNRHRKRLRAVLRIDLAP